MERPPTLLDGAANALDARLVGRPAVLKIATQRRPVLDRRERLVIGSRRPTARRAGGSLSASTGLVVLLIVCPGSWFCPPEPGLSSIPVPRRTTRDGAPGRPFSHDSGTNVTAACALQSLVDAF